LHLSSVRDIFLAFIINQSMLVGQSTAESVLEFPKNDIQNIRSVVREFEWNPWFDDIDDESDCINDVIELGRERKMQLFR